MNAQPGKPDAPPEQPAPNPNQEEIPLEKEHEQKETVPGKREEEWRSPNSAR